MTAPEHRFGEFRLAPGARELWRGEQLIALPPKSFDCLAYLIEHRERAVGRDELISAVWGRADVSDDLLAQTLLRARRAVGDTGNEQRAIRTVPRFGYRWILPLEEVAEAPPTDSARTLRAAATRASGSRRGWLALLLALAVAVAALLLWQWREHAAPPPRSAAGGVLVLPVQREGGDNESAWLRLGAMDYIATQLRERARLPVLPSEQTLLLIGRDTDPTDAGALHRLELATGAGYVLAPSATFEHGEWKFLLDAYHDGGVRSFEARGSNPLEAAAIVIDRFLADLGLAARAPAASSPAAAMQNQRIDAAMLEGDLDAARRLIDALPPAERQDPEVVVRSGQIAFRAGQLQAAGAAFQPLANAATAPAIRAQAQSGLGAVALRQGDFDEAERQYSAAIASLGQSNEAPADLVGYAYNGRGAANAARNHFDAALADFGRARVELDRAGDRTGTATVEVNLGLLEGNRGHYGDAVQAFDRAIAIFQRFGVRDHLAAALLGKSNAQLALLDNAAALATGARAEELSAQLENALLRRRIAAMRIATRLANGQLDAAQGALDAAAAEEGPEFDLLRAQLALERGDVAGAARRLGVVLSRPSTARTDVNLGDAMQLAVTAVRRGADPALLDQALARREDEPGTQVAFELARRLGQAQQLASRDDPGAAAAFADAFAEADRRGLPDAVVAAGVAYADYLIRHAQAESAATVVGRLSPYAERDYRAAHAVAIVYRALGNAELARNADAQARRLAGQRDPTLPL